jgi:hypothetical protein
MGKGFKRVTHIEGCAKLGMHATINTICTCAGQRRVKQDARIVRGHTGSYASLGDALPTPGCYITPARRCPS